MKTTQDWSFIIKEKALPKPLMRENNVFHALTSAYAKNQELEVYTATENIMRREKELCQASIRDLQNLVGGGDETLGLILEHYKNRMEIATAKESKLKILSEDSKKMNEEYRKKNQELAEVKRNLMESQSKLREMNKVAEKLSKKEEELRFIENHLKQELEKNRKEMVNGLYEIVADISEGDSPLGSKSTYLKPSADGEVVTPQAQAKPVDKPFNQKPNPIQNVSIVAMPKPTVISEVNEPQPVIQGRTIFDNSPIPADLPRSAMPPWVPVEAPTRDGRRIQLLSERYSRIKLIEPSKSICAKSLVKSPDGTLLCEYFFPIEIEKEERHYIFNTVYTLNFLLNCLDKDTALFTKNLETAFGDLTSRLDHSHNIHLEAGCKDFLNRDSLGRILSLGIQDKPNSFLDLAENCIQRFEALGHKRVEMMESQFENLIAA